MRIFVCALVIAVLCAPVRGGAPKKDGAALFAHARQVSGLTETGSAPFRMKIHFKLLGTRAGTAEGSYELWWQSPEKSTAEITAGDYTERVLSVPGKTYETRTSAYAPLRIWQLKQLLERALAIRVPKADRLKVTSEKIDEQPADCVEAITKDSEGQRACFDQETGTLLTLGRAPTQHYGEYSAFGSKLFPRLLRVTDAGRTLVEAHVDELEHASQIDPSVFLIRAPAEEWPACEDPQPAELVGRVPPEYPQQSRMAHQQGIVIAMITIDETGAVQNPMIVQSAGRRLDDAALLAIRQWKYLPASCGGVPMKTRMQVSTSFALGG